MTWQEYQEAVAVLYEEAEGIGEVRRNIMVPDRITGQNRQVDALLVVETKGHLLQILIDAKFHSEPLDVRDVESVAALAGAVGACSSIIVALNGWTEPASLKAKHLGCDLRLLTLDDALGYIVADKWMICPACDKDCVVMDQDGYVQFDYGGIVWWIAGACRKCRHMLVWCQDCGAKFGVANGDSVVCGCSYQWSNKDGILGILFLEREEDEP